MPTDAPTSAAHAPEAEPAANRAPAPKKEHFTMCGFHLQHSIMGLRRAN